MQINRDSEVFNVVAGALSLASPAHPMPRYVTPRSSLQVNVHGSRGINWRLLVTTINARIPAMPPITVEEASGCITVADLCRLVASRQSGESSVTNTLTPRQTYACSLLVGQLRDFTPEALRGFGEYLATRDGDRDLVLDQLRKMVSSIVSHAPGSGTSQVLPFRHKVND